MKDKTKSIIDSLLTKHERHKEEVRKSIDETKREGEAFLKEFYQLREKVINPVMKEIGDYLESKGHKYHISKSDEGTDSIGKTIAAKIHMNIFPDGKRYVSLEVYEYPYISFTANPRAKVVSLHLNNIAPGKGGLSGGKGEYVISNISEDFVEKEITKLLEDIL